MSFKIFRGLPSSLPTNWHQPKFWWRWNWYRWCRWINYFWCIGAAVILYAIRLSCNKSKKKKMTWQFYFAYNIFCFILVHDYLELKLTKANPARSSRNVFKAALYRNISLGINMPSVSFLSTSSHNVDQICLLFRKFIRECCLSNRITKH